MTALRAYPHTRLAWKRLAGYLGDTYQPELTDFSTLRHYLDDEWRQLTPHFYEHSIGYLYDLTHFHYMGAKDSFFQLLTDFCSKNNITRLADIGCGIGLDLQALLHAGFTVNGYDLDNPSLHYGQWRLDHDLTAGHHIKPITQLPGKHYELAYAVDVLGHTDNPEHLIRTLFATADYIALNLGPHDPRHRYGAADLHPGLDHKQVLAHLHAHGHLLHIASSGPCVSMIWRRKQCTMEGRELARWL